MGTPDARRALGTSLLGLGHWALRRLRWSGLGGTRNARRCACQESIDFRISRRGSCRWSSRTSSMQWFPADPHRAMRASVNRFRSRQRSPQRKLQKVSSDSNIKNLRTTTALPRRHSERRRRICCAAIDEDIGRRKSSTRLGRFRKGARHHERLASVAARQNQRRGETKSRKEAARIPRITGQGPTSVRRTRGPTPNARQ